MDINTLLEEFQKLSPFLQDTFFNMIYPVVKNSSNKVNDYLETIRETRFSKGTFCPHCNSVNIIGHGKYRSRQRYKCKDCSKTFNDVSCSPMSGTHYPQKWGQYLQFIAEGTTLPKIAKALNISVSTKFMNNYLYWHRFLELNKSLDKVELKKTILTNVLAMNKSTIISDLRPIKTP